MSDIRSLRGAPQGMRWLQSRDNVVPAACYDPCNNASLEAQTVGKSSALCSPDSTFLSYYATCEACVRSSLSASAAQEFLNSTFGQWLAFCQGTTTTVATVIPTSTPSTNTLTQSHNTETQSSNTQTQSSNTQTQSSNIQTEYTIIVTIPYTVVTNGLNTVVSLEKTLISFPPRPITTVIAIDTSQDGHPTIWTFTTILTPLPRESLVTITEDISSSIVTQDTSSSTPRTSEGPTLDPVNTTMNAGVQKSQVWIAGPVIGAIAGLAIILLASWLLFRARSKRRSGHEVHGDSAFKSELEAKSKPQELDGQGQDGRPAELPTTDA